MKKIRLLIITQLLALTSVYSQSAFDPFPKLNIADYHLNFNIFFKAPNTAAIDCEKLTGLLSHVRSLKGKTGLNSNNLLRALCLMDSIQIKYIRLYNYYDLLVSVNRDDDVSRRQRDKITSRFDETISTLEQELINLPQSRFENFVKERPALKKYTYLMQSYFQLKTHNYAPDLLNFIQTLLPSINGWQYDLFETITNNTSFPSINTSTGELNVLRDRFLIDTNPDSVVRKTGFLKLHSNFESYSNLYAFALINECKALDQVAKLRGFRNAPESFYHDKFYSETAINGLLKQIADSVNIYRDYQKMRKVFLVKQGLDKEPSLWDMKISLSKTFPLYTIDSATTIIQGALNPLSEDFQAELVKLFNPENGRLEIAPGEKKKLANFSRGYIGSKSIFYSSSYKGSYNDIRVLTHEGTHAVHRELMNQNNVLPSYANGPNYIFESFAILSEFLLSDYLIINCDDIDQKIFFLEKHFEGKGMAIFSIGQDALLEQSIHEGVIQGSINNARDMESVNNKINEKFSIWSTKEYPQQNLRCITNSLFYEDPLYNINYVLGAVLALQYYNLYKKNPKVFGIAYSSLLKNGFTDEPSVLLSKFFGIDINDPNLLINSMEIMRGKLSELERLYELKSKK